MRLYAGTIIAVLGIVASAHATQRPGADKTPIARPAPAGRIDAPTPEGDAALKGLYQFFEGIRTKDLATLEAHSVPGMLIVSKRPDGIRRLTVQQLHALFVGTKEALSVRLLDTIVHADQGLAEIWATYEYHTGAEVACGKESFTLVNDDGRWLVAGIADNRWERCRS